MSVARLRPEGVDTVDAGASPLPLAHASEARHTALDMPLPQARIADELAVPAPSPVHQLQAELAQLTLPREPAPEPGYPGWFRLGFPIVSSVLLWAAILWGVSRLA